MTHTHVYHERRSLLAAFLVSGQAIIIYPQKDNSFLYDQIDDSPDNYSNFEDFTKGIKKNKWLK